MSTADRRRLLHGLDREGRRLAGRLVDDYGPWDPASLQTLRCYVESVGRLRTISDDGDRRRETYVMLALWKALDLER